MIARLWHGWTTPADADPYEALLRGKILPGIHRVAGRRQRHRGGGDPTRGPRPAGPVRPAFDTLQDHPGAGVGDGERHGCTRQMTGMQFWFEFGSTYSYLAAMRIEALASASRVPVEWKPFLLGPLFQRQGWNDSPYVLNPARGRYMWRDIERLCRQHGLPFRRPTRFPRRSLLAARVAILGEGHPWLPDFARAVYQANFAEDRDIADPSLLAGILDALGQEGGRLLDLAIAPDNKERLRTQTEQAWELGIFGAPSFVVDGELFWGQDRIEQALDWWRKAHGEGAA